MHGSGHTIWEANPEWVHRYGLAAQMPPQVLATLFQAPAPEEQSAQPVLPPREGSCTCVACRTCL